MTGSKLKKVEIDCSGLQMSRSGWEWMGVGGSGFEWMEVGGSGWE